MLCVVVNVGGKQNWSIHECKMTWTILCQAIIEKQWAWAANMLFLFEMIIIIFTILSPCCMLHVAWNVELKHARLLWIFNTVCCEASPVRCQFYHKKTIVIWARMKRHDVSLLSIGQILPLNLCFEPFALMADWTSSGLMPCLLMAPVHIFLWLVWKTAFKMFVKESIAWWECVQVVSMVL